MKKSHLKFLVCPNCRVELQLKKVEGEINGRIESGELICSKCNEVFPIIRFIPRFVPIDNYASGFGFEWTKHAKTQYDIFTGTKVSEERFFNETKWPRCLIGETILEVGSGSGRFTEQAASTGAMVVSLDFSYAVEANYKSNGLKENVLIVQGDIYKLPVPENFFDRVFCFGVLQHTPDVRRAFFSLLTVLKSGGHIAIDVYRKNRGILGLLSTKYWIRPFTKNMPPERLYKLCKKYIRLMWPFSQVIARIPVLGRKINQFFLIPNYSGVIDLSEELLFEWAVLDCFDMLSPMYDNPQTVETVMNWFSEAGLKNSEVHCGYNGIEGRGVKP